MSKITIDAAEKLAGRRLDRRFNYYLYNGQLCTYGTWTESCSGCFEGGEYDGLVHHYLFDNKRQCSIGSGCDECGYTGKRITGWPEPVEGFVDPIQLYLSQVTPPTEEPAE
mgnify:CR=1 FL=1